MSFRIYTDSGCDIRSEVLKEWGVASEPLTFRFAEEDKEYSNNDMEIGAFYDRMRRGEVAKTAAVNASRFASAFEEALKAGEDVLYVGFSSGLSTTYNSARIAAGELAPKYPDRKIMVLDSLCASAGEGMLVKLAVDKRDEGATVTETAAYVEEIKGKVCHWFTVDDLVYLKRGGRISPTTAFVGNLLGIKPVLHVDDEGHLVNVTKVRGRRAAVVALADKYGETAITKEGGVAYISHADCLADAELLASILKEKYGANVEVITDVGTVIGAHAGPGTLALFFIGEAR